MYDFLGANQFIVADFNEMQSVNYTYFVHKCNHNSWIDHGTKTYDIDSISMCKIVSEDDGNTSKHQSICFQINVKVQPQEKSVATKIQRPFPQVPCWNNYRHHLVQIATSAVAPRHTTAGCHKFPG